MHDSVFPYGPDQQLAAACGIRKAFGAIEMVETQAGREHRVLLATANERDPMQRFPIRALSPGHPILRGVGDFDLAEEVWAQNLAAGSIRCRVCKWVILSRRISAFGNRFRLATLPDPVLTDNRSRSVKGRGRFPPAIRKLGREPTLLGIVVVRQILRRLPPRSTTINGAV